MLRKAITATVLFACCATLTVQALPAPTPPVIERRLLPRYSTGFSIDYLRGGYRLVTVTRPWPGAAASFQYLLYDGTSSPPPDTLAPTARRVATPISRVVSFSSTYIPPIIALEEGDAILGVDAAAYINEPTVRARLARGSTVEVTKNWMPDIERIIALKPDAVFTYGMGNEWDTHPKLAEAGLPIIVSGDWNETLPLARAEWIKFIAVFFNKEAVAETIFSRIESSYLEIKTKAAQAKGKKPRVLLYGPFQGNWAVPGGGSYMARFIADAGGDYLWAQDRSTGSLVLSVESVFSRGLSADVWLAPGADIKSLTDVAALDPRFAALPAVRRGEVWNNTRRVNAQGGNDFYESAVLAPDLVLADLVRILHPEVLPAGEFTYFRKLDR